MNDPLRTPTDAMPKGIRKGWILIVIAAVVSYGLYHILPYDENANKGLALLTFIAILWLTEAIHITITALLIPILAVVLAMPMAKGDELEPITTQAALTTFADPTIFLFLVVLPWPRRCISRNWTRKLPRGLSRFPVDISVRQYWLSF